MFKFDLMYCVYYLLLITFIQKHTLNLTLQEFIPPLIIKFIHLLRCVLAVGRYMLTDI